MAQFQDHFSKQSDTYLQARPTYPDELFAFLASIAPSRQVCLDCATGNGQAAVSLIKHFHKVIAIDASEKQIANALVTPGIEYRVATAEESGMADASVDIITVATGAHWFNLDKFYPEALRIAKPNGILAVWTYSAATVGVEIDAIMEWFMYDYLYTYWPDGRWYARNKYVNLPFPFPELKTPAFQCNMLWSLPQWLNYVKSWSAYTNYVTRHGNQPLDILLSKLKPYWADDEKKQVVWPLHLKCARLNSV